MNEGLYCDTYVHSQLSPSKRLQRNLMLAACVLIPVLGMVLIGGWIILLLVLIIDVVLIYFLPNKKVDYEYVFVDGQIDFDRIIAGNTRKNMTKTDLEQTDVVAPEGSHALDGYQNLDVLDYSSGNSTDRHYILVAKSEKGKIKIRFTPNEKMLEMMKMKARSKISD